MNYFRCVVIVGLMALSGVSMSGVSMGESKPERPNFVFILADDLGCMDIGCEGSTFYETPHIDSIANAGMRFTQGYAACQVCSPSRGSIMLGVFPTRHGITDYIGAPSGEQWKRNDRVLPASYSNHLPHARTTVAEALRDTGYRTFFAGKWHLGSEGSLPEDHGFSINKGGHFRGSPPGGYFSPYKNPKLEDGPAGESLPRRLAGETATFIRDNSSRPFFAFLSFYSVHGPIQTTQPLWKKYRDKALLGKPVGERFLVDRTLPVRQVQDCPIYAGMMESMDDAVGVVLAALDEVGAADNTVVVFTSDNGGVSSGDAYATSNLPLRGGKGRQWEGGIREPYYIKAPGVANPGSTCDTVVSGIDFFPTIAELAGIDPPQDIDGISLVPLLKGQSISERDLFWHYPHYGNQGGEPSSIIRRGDWKLIHYWEDGRDELYNVAADIGEQKDQASAEPERAKQMRHRLDQWLKQTDAKLPRANPRFDADKREVQDRQVRERKKPQLERQHGNFLNEGFKPNAAWWGSLQADD